MPVVVRSWGAGEAETGEHRGFVGQWNDSGWPIPGGELWTSGDDDVPVRVGALRTALRGVLVRGDCA